MTSESSVVIYGNGAMARTLVSFMRRSATVAGFTVDDACVAAGADTLCGLPLVPFSRVQERFGPARHRMIVGVGFIDMNGLREKKTLEAEEKGYKLASFVHDSVLIHDDVSIGEGSIVLDHVALHPGCRVGRGTFISSSASLGHDCTLGAFNWINSGVAAGGGCRIGASCFFGVNASLAHGISVGARTFVGANTLLVRDTNDDEVYISAGGERSRLQSRAFLRFSGMTG